MHIVSGILLSAALLLSAPTWGEEPFICEVGDYVQYRQELAQEAIKLKEAATKTTATKPKVVLEIEKEAALAEPTTAPLQAGISDGWSPIHTLSRTLAGQTWGDRSKGEWFGRSKKLA